ncbi:hypothetical protein XH81_04265 [Bradyrhizobium sp. CCBAU 25360]|uniref:DUF3616 domain-containing protein n=1 Tax=Bradyrhizobium sp. CCBAU 25360 TaxID=858425 RepID=UPI0023054593|nr:DUF3616 domain-containing protein [Bradyrhizobium sp. CCBAU 25360]MDA9414079.1 hypothetical protein [Bradyrhizobium sp. CCBAU 25360]
MTNHSLCRSRGLSLVSAIILGAVLLPTSGLVPAWAQDHWKVHQKLLGKPKDVQPDTMDKAKDVSGIACDTTSGFPRVCLLVDDESQGTQVVIVRDGDLVAGPFIRLMYDTWDDKPLELDAEAVAYADGSFYVIGSHGRPRHHPEDAKKEAKNRAKAAATRRIFRIRFARDAIDRETGNLSGAVEIIPSIELARLIPREPELTAAFDRELADNGLTIEGLAVRGGQLYLGMRGPVVSNTPASDCEVDGTAAVLVVPIETVFTGGSDQTNFKHVDLGRDTHQRTRGIRDMAPYDGAFLMLAGPVNDPPDGTPIPKGDYSIYRWDGHSRKATLLADLGGFPEKVKPEALLPLDRSGNSVRALLFFDGPSEGEPTPIRFDLQ